MYEVYHDSLRSIKGFSLIFSSCVNSLDNAVVFENWKRVPICLYYLVQSTFGHLLPYVPRTKLLAYLICANTTLCGLIIMFRLICSMMVKGVRKARKRNFIILFFSHFYIFIAFDIS